MSVSGRVRLISPGQTYVGKQVFIPADVPHAPCNESGAPCTWIVVHSSGSDQDGIVLLPALDALLASRAA